ncbi:MAG: hypothetical protein EBU70_14875, partial [Actinobacteria bacterium]|nr:hypothetical protein [Actinomycetota bacterium]
NASTGVLNVGAVTGNGNSLTLDSGSTAGATMSVTSFSNATGGLTLVDAGGLVTIGDVGSAGAGAVTITDSQGGVTFSANVDATTLTITATSGDITFANGQDVDISGSLGTAADGYGVRILSSTFDAAGDTTFLNTGASTLGNGAGDVLTFAGGLDTTGVTGGLSVAGTVRTSGARMDLGAVALAAATTLDTGNSALGILNVGAVTSGANSLTLASGGNAAADITVASFAGTGHLTVADSGGTTFTGDVTAGAVTLADTTGTIAFQGNLTASSIVASASGFGVSITGTSNSVSGASSFQNTGTLTLGNASGDTMSFAGGLTATGGPVSAAGTITTTNTGLSLGAVTMTDALAIRSGSGSVSVVSVTDGAS